jgi:hypothetical protein
MLSLLQKSPVSRLQRTAALAFICGMLSIAVGCGGSSLNQSTQSTTQPQSLIKVSLSPGTALLSPGAQQQFTATVQGTSNSAVIWLASAGSISNNGIYTAPTATSGAPISITATSVADSAQRATSTITMQTAARLSISTSSLAGATVNMPYGASLLASGGTPPYNWTISGGSIAPGIQFGSATGEFTGTASQQGSYSFTAKVTDAAANSASENLTLNVAAATSGAQFDGPAELPLVYLQTTLADTPAPGSIITVNSGGNLQSALNSASCGDTIELQAGATFSGNQITLPAKSCDDQHWIIIRTTTPDANLPPEATRMTPCYAGVASLPGRPAFPCTNPQRLLPTIVYTGTGSGPIMLANGANHYRLLGLEITRTANDGLPVTALVSAVTGGSMTEIVLDRVYLHGTPTDETRRGVDLTGGTSIAVQDSYLSNFHCAVKGTCTDSQAVSGGLGGLPGGPYRIVDNFLEASGENILFGGGAATTTPTDMEIRLNHLFKPMFWMQGQPGFTAPAFIVKNHFELKNGQRVLFDSNILENTWGGFSQFGDSILITPKNQSINGDNVCPTCQVTDVTVRYTTISHVAGALQIANILAPPNGVALQGQRYSIHDIIADDIDGTTYAGNGIFAEISTIAQPLLQNVAINHVTAFPPQTMLNIGGPNTVKMPGIAMTNSIVTSGEYPVWSTGALGSADCAFYDVPLKTMGLCFTGYTFAYNAILNASTQYQAPAWPSGNFFYTTSDIDFVNYNNGNGGDYHLLPSSPAKGAGSDGLDLGANVDAVYQAISGVN